MKCPSKEIDKNNISLLLLNNELLIVSLNCNIQLGLCLLVVPWWFCSLWRSCVYLGTSVVAEDTPVCPQVQTCPLVLARLRGCRTSLFLSISEP